MEFLLANPNLKTTKKSLKDSPGKITNKNAEGGLNKKSSERAMGEGSDRAKWHGPIVPFFWYSGSALHRPFLACFCCFCPSSVLFMVLALFELISYRM